MGNISKPKISFECNAKVDDKAHPIFTLENGKFPSNGIIKDRGRKS